MEGKQDHNKIIRRAAGEVLKPLGLFQVGQSRLWIDDNGWFLTLVEFQPSGFSKGSYLNVALHFLWGRDISSAAHSFNFPVGGAIRQNAFVALADHETDFYEAMTAMAQKAARLVEEYRQFRDLTHARQALLEAKRNTSHDILHKMMICGLTKDPLAERYYHQLIVISEDFCKKNPEVDYMAKDLDYANSFGKMVYDPDLFQARIVELVNERRDYLHTKPSYKKLNPEPFICPTVSLEPSPVPPINLLNRREHEWPDYLAPSNHRSALKKGGFLETLFSGLRPHTKKEVNIMPKYDTIIFDLDGTLLDTLDDLMDAANYALEQLGWPLRSKDEIRSFVGNGVAKLMERAVPAGTDSEGAAKALELFTAYYDIHKKDKTAPYEGISEMLVVLKEKGLTLAVVSNKFDAAVKGLMTQYFPGLIDMSAGEAEAAGIPKKPHPAMVHSVINALGADPGRAVYVGDSDVDLQTAQNAGLPCISVTWGFRDEDFLRAHGGTTFVHTPDQLVRLICE